jgi:phospholipid/cholesterol/gamma-HCH transport system substrate-binding protein
LGQRIGSSIENIQKVTNNLITVSNQLQIVVQNVNSGKGVLGTVISDTVMADDLKRSVEKIREGSEQFSLVTSDVRSVLKDVNSGQGTVTTLLKDSAMANDLKSSMSNLEKATITLNEELEALKHSFLLRPFYKHQKQPQH